MLAAVVTTVSLAFLAQLALTHRKAVRAFRRRAAGLADRCFG
jgi:hypothetical protein